MTARIRFRDAFTAYVPQWLSDRPSTNVAYRTIWAMSSVLDAAAEVLVQGLQAPYPGVGTPTALPLIARSRGIARGLADTDASAAATLRGWLDARKRKGSARELARQIQAYLPGSPRVRVITRSGVWTTLESDGTITVENAPWDWDSSSHPERNDPAAPWWSNLFVVIYSTAYVNQGVFGGGTKFGDNEGLGQRIPREQSDELRGIMREWKRASTRIRCVIWCPDPTKFDPTDPGTCPDGFWGAWSLAAYGGNSYRVPSHRFTFCRYWEF